jgi:hypothetical protein
MQAGSVTSAPANGGGGSGRGRGVGLQVPGETNESVITEEMCQVGFVGDPHCGVDASGGRTFTAFCNGVGR